MKIAVVHHTSLARVRRGGERFMHEVASYMAGKGHDVTVISCKPGRSESIKINGYVSSAHRRWWIPALGRLGIHEYHTFLLTGFWQLLRTRYDVIQCVGFESAFAARMARWFTGTPYVFIVNAIPPPVDYYRRLSLGGRLFHAAVRGADEIICISRFMQSYCRERYLREGVLIAPPVDTRSFRLADLPPANRPTILCTSALQDERKGGMFLMRAFNLIKTAQPEVVLQIASEVTGQLQAKLLAEVEARWRPDVLFLGDGDFEALPNLYAQASVTVLPSRWESYGMVVAESMACGTPVVGSREGALPETISNPMVGRLFDVGETEGIAPINVEGFCEAVLQALELSQDPETAARCREHAEQRSWDVLGPDYESLYQQLAQNRGTAKGDS